jgi:hypothetical protein
MRKIVSATVAVIALVACSSSNSNNGATTTKDAGSTTADGGGSAAGVVPADLRDVERDGEGLVSTTFGNYPDRTADWTRAASVLSLLQQVWVRGKAANPAMPAAQVKMVDDAIVALGAGIGAKDQEKAAYAANAVGLAVPEIFDSFHPDAPIGVVRMDAMYRQLGLDAHFKHLDAVKKDVDSLKSDWANTKGPVGTRAPTCHRVGGTATVTGDIDTSLANVDVALPAADVTTIEKESDNGALEIDTLELLFDCPADNVTPNHGLGAKCGSDADCDSGQACDKANAGGKCAPASSNKIGTPCNSTVDCGSDARSACQTASGDNYPGGYCFMEPCNDIEVCPSGATCVAIGGETPGCFKSCATDSDCRGSDGYVCQLFLTTPPKGFGPTDHACAFKCTRDTDCQSPLKCDVAAGKCTP